MSDEILYMLGIVAVGFLVNYSLRALPFVLFSRRRGELPRWVERFGAFISPVIIGALIVYSYSGSAWRTPWPYLAGVLTVALQLWRRNPLMSIVAGTLVYMLLLNCCGCATPRTLEFDEENTPIRVTTQGVLFAEESIAPTEVAAILEDYDVPHDRSICILLDPEVKDLRPARYLMACMGRAGYTSTILVTQRHAESLNLGKKRKTSAWTTPKREKKKAIRYKKANE